MLILKYNTLSSESLFKIERQYLRWKDGTTNKTSSYDKQHQAEINVLDATTTQDLYGYLLGMFDDLQILSTLSITPSQFLDFLIDVDEQYHDTPYHSFYHAADVVIVLYHIMMDLKAKKFLSNIEIAILFISAICHDAGHNGFNNDFYCKLNTELAIRYQYSSVLESLSVDISNEIISNHQLQVNKDVMKELILSTDMAYHYELLNQASILEDVLSSIHLWQQQEEEDEDDDEDDDMMLSETLSMTETTTPLLPTTTSSVNTTIHENNTILNQEQRLSFMKIILHAADISNTVRPWPISKQWSDLIVQEFFTQGDLEKQHGLPVSPGMDRDLATQASISLKFGDYVVKPYFEAIASLLPTYGFLDNLQENQEEWTKLKQSPLATSINLSGFLQSRFGVNRKVSVPAGTVQLLPSPSTSSSGKATKPMTILRTTSQSNMLISPPSGTEVKRRNSLRK